MYSEEVIRRVRDSVDIQELISGYVTLKRTGKNWQGLCPFHSEKTPSFSVNPDKQIFHCFGCGVGGDAFKFLELQKGLNFPEAVRELAERANITLPESRPGVDHRKTQDERKALLVVLADAAEHFRRELEAPGGSAARAYLAKRGVSEAIVREFGIGYSRPDWEGLLRDLKQKGHGPALLEKAGLVIRRSEGEGHYDRFRGRIIFPIRDIDGKVIAFGGRVMDDSLPKYLNSPETPLYSKSNILFCMDMAKEAARKQGYFIIVEGYLDALACHQYGVRNAVATLGTALTDSHLRIISRIVQKLILIFDPDPAGIRATIRGFDSLVQSGLKVNVVSLPDGHDPDTFFQKNGAGKFNEVLKNSVKLMDFVHAEVVKIGASAPIDDRVDIAKVMAGFIDKLPDRNVQNHYIKKLIDDLNIDEAVFRLDKFRAKLQPEQRREELTAPLLRTKPQAEEMLIHLMLRDQTSAKRARALIAPDDFTDPAFKRVAEKIFEKVLNNGALDVRTVFLEGDDDLKKLVSHYSVLELAWEHDDDSRAVEIGKNKAFNDCIGLIKESSIARKRKVLLAAIQAAEARGDREQLDMLQRELLQMRKGGA